MKLGRKVWLFLLFLGLATSIFVGWQRLTVERANKTVELVLDYQDAFGLAQIQGYNLDRVLNKFKQAGVISLALSEKTLDDLQSMGKVGILTDSQVASISILTGQKEMPQGGQTYLLTNQSKVYQQLKRGLINKLGQTKVKDNSQAGKYILQVMLPYEQIKDLPLYISQEELEKAKEMGFKVVPRLGNYSRVDDPGINDIFAQLGNENSFSTVVFLGKEVLGYSTPKNYLAATKENIEKRKMKLGLIEFNEQKGLATLAKELNYQAVRVHSIPSEEAEKMTMDTALARWVRAVEERNVRLVYLRPLVSQEALEGRDPLIANLKLVRDLKASLMASGFNIGQASSFAHYQIGLLPVLLISLAILAGMVLLWQIFFPTFILGEYLIFLGGLGAILLLVFTGHTYQVRKLLALGSALVFPTLGVLRLIKDWQEDNKEHSYLLALIKTSSYSLVGGLLIAALLADTSFFLKLNSFSGVKFLHLIPLLMITIYYFLFYQQEGGILASFNRFLNQPVLVKYLLAFFLLAGMGVVYILRTGNETGPLPVSGLELKFRHLLEEVLIARPRTKEFLLGHPALILGTFLAGRQKGGYLFLFIVLAAIGQISIVSTFTHIHTPLSLSLLRIFNGLVLGSLIGSILVAVLKYIQRGEK